MRPLEYGNFDIGKIRKHNLLVAAVTKTPMTFKCVSSCIHTLPFARFHSLRVIACESNVMHYSYTDSKLAYAVIKTEWLSLVPKMPLYDCTTILVSFSEDFCKWLRYTFFL